MWKPNTVYAAGAKVVNASGSLVKAIAHFTSGSAYSAGNWAVVCSCGPDTQLLRRRNNLSGPRGAPVYCPTGSRPRRTTAQLFQHDVRAWG